MDRQKKEKIRARAQMQKGYGTAGSAGRDRSMIENEKMPMPDDGESGGQQEKLKTLLQEAYPVPETGKIARNVMAQIRLERMEAEQSRRLEKNAKRRRFQASVMKWGGLAACMVLISGAIVMASPILRGGNEAEAALADEAAPAEVYQYSARTTEDALETFAEAFAADVYSTGGTAVKEEVAAEAEEAGGTTLQNNGAVLKTMCCSAPSATYTDAAYDGEEPESPAAPAETEEDTRIEETDPALRNAVVLVMYKNAGLLNDGAYSAWMQEKGYAGPADWTVEELMEAFGLPPVDTLE